MMSRGVGYKFDDENCYLDYGVSFICEVGEYECLCLMLELVYVNVFILAL